MTYEEWVEKKKKEKAQKSSSYSEWVEATRGIDLDDIAPVTTTRSRDDDDDIAPAKKWYQGYLQKSGVFDDGYQFGDITKAKNASEQDARENVASGILGIGEKVVDALAWLAPAFNASQAVQNTGGVIWERDKNGKLVAKSAFDIDTYREQQNASAEFIKKDLYDEKKVAQKILLHDVYEKGLGTSVEGASVFGDKSDSLLQSAGQMGATALMSPVVPWWLTTGATAFGSQAEEALNEGASYESAGASAAIAAGAEVLTEKLGGIKFGGLTVTDKFLKPLTNKIPSKVLKALADAGIDAVGEGVEEYVTEICNQLGSSLYKEENAWEILASEEAVDARIDSLVGGMIMGGAFGSVNTIIDSKKANLTETEQKVVDKVTEDRIAEESKKGKVDEAQKLKIREEVIEDMDAGRLSLDTIEETLGGDTYKSYKDTVDSTESMKKELEELNNMKTGDLTGAQSDRLAELKGMNLTDTSKQDGLKNQLRQEVYQMTKGSRLGNSYGENYKRTQSFTADLSKYDTKQQEVIKRAVESGILNDTRRTHEFVDMVAKISADKGVLFNFANNAKLKESGFAIEGKTINGFVKDGNVTVNIQSVKALDTVVGHEITHVLEGTELYAELQQAVKAYATTKGEYDTRLQALTKLYEGIDGTDVEAELTADLVGDYLFTDENFVNRLSTEHRNIFQKIFDEIKYLWKTATAGSKEARELERVKKLFETAYREGGKTQTQVNGEGKLKYNLSEDAGLYQYIQDSLSGKVSKKSYHKLSDTISDRLANDIEKIVGFSVDGFGNEISRGNIEHINKDHGVNGKSDQSMSDLHDLAKINYVIENYDNIREGKESREYKNKDGSNAKTVELQKKIDSGFYYVVEAVPDAKLKTLHVVSAYINKNDTFLEVAVSKDPSRYVHDELQSNVSSNDSIPQNTKNATRFSLSEDSDSNYLSAVERGDMDTAQKMVDEVAKKAGYDIEGYHGTDEDFWTFSLENRGRNGEMLGVGYYFTADKKMADMYTNNSGKVKHVYLDIKKPINTKELMITPEEWGKFLDYAEKHKNEYIESVWKGNSINKDFELRYMSDFENDAELIKTFIDTTAGRNATVAEGYLKMLKDSIGYDGVNYQNGDAKVYVAFTPEQIKSADNVTYDDSGNVIPLSERFNADKSDIRYSLSNDEDIAPVGGRFYGKDIMLETEDIAPVSKTETTVAENAPVAPVRGNEPTQETNKTVPPNDGGVTDNSSLATSTSTVSNNIIPQNTPSINPTETISDAETPSGEMRSWVETSTESEAVGRAILPDDLDTEKIYYQPISNKKTLGNANARLDSLGYEDAVTYFNGQFANKNISLDDIAFGERLIQEAVKKGDYKTAGELITDISILGTELGQKVQALSIIKRLTPEGQLRAIQRTVERGKTKGDKVFEGVEVTQEMTDQILKTYKEDGTYDQNELNAAVENVKQQIADQMKVTKLEQVNAWRYLSMLGNPKTHIRNLVSNIAMKGTVAVKNAIARTVEDIAPIKNRTKTWKRSTETVKEFSRQKAVELKEVISGGGKYGESAEIKAKREIFKNKILEGVYGFNSEMLSKEDWWFSRPAFTNALSECLTANGIRTQEDIDGNPEMVEKAIQYAIEQAQIATFQQTSWLANKISEMERKNTLTNIAVGSILPFKKTPINIAKTGLNYSPLGFLKTAFYDVPKVKQGDMNASEMIDHLAQNITGSALTLAGYMLASTGFLNGAGEDDKEGKYDYQLGEQAYSINFGGSTYSLSWLSPVAMPLFVGVNMYEQFVEKNEWNGNVVIETMAKTLDPLSEMSFLSSLDSTLSSYDSGIMKFAGIFETAAQSYIGQFAPTLGSQIATVIDDTKRTTKVSGNSGNTFAEETFNKLIYKIPFLRETLEPSIDIWGNEIKQTENVMERAFETFLAPYAKRDDISSDVDAEIKDLYAQTGDNGLIPSAPYNYINYSGEKYNMSAKEYTDFKKEYGQTAFELLDELFDTTSYRSADSETKAELVNKVYDYARDEAKRDFFSDRGIEYDYEEDLIKGAIENDMLPDEYAFSIKYPEKYDFFKNNGISYNDYADADEEGKRAYTWAYDNPGKYTMSKVISDDFMTYYGYRSELNDIESDKDANGDTVSGSKKTKVINYINDMDLDYGQKIILYRSMYSSKEDRANYNADIVDYLNSRDDISYDEMVSILEELDMKVSSDGTVTWD